MAFEGKPESLTLAEILSLIRSQNRSGMLSFHSHQGTFYLALHDGKLTGIGSSITPVAVIRILLDRGVLSSEQYQKLALENQSMLDDLSMIRLIPSVSEEQIQLAIYHQAEQLFFALLDVTDGNYDYSIHQTHDFIMFDIAFRDWIDELIPSIETMKQVRAEIADLDSKIIWASPDEVQDLPERLSLDELKILSQYRPGISFRGFWYILTETRVRIINALCKLQKLGIFTTIPPNKAKLPDSRPFLRALLASALQRIDDVFRLIGSESEIVTILRSISENLAKMQPQTMHQVASPHAETLDDLSSITSSIEDILSLDNLEDLDIKSESPPIDQSQAKETTARSYSYSSRSPEASKSSESISPPPNQKAPNASISADDEDGNEGDAVTLEDIVAAKVRYKKFVSNVTMAFNRMRMKNITYFDMLNIPPNADRKAIHASFVKSIRKINPSGVDLKERDKESIEKAIFVRDKLKEAYQILMDPKARRAYVLTIKEARETDERKKSEAMILFNRGMIEFKNSNFIKARELFQQAIELDPKSPVYYEMISDIDKEELAISANKFFQAGTLAFSQKNDYDRAIKLIKKAISLLPRQTAFHLKLAEIQATRHELRRDAIQNYEIVIEMDPSNPELHLALAHFYKSCDMKQEASNKYQDVLKWNPDNLTAKKELLALRKEGLLPQKRTDQEKEKPQANIDADLL